MQELAGMPEPASLRRVESAGRCLVTAGGRVLFCYDSDDVGMRNLAVVALTDAGVAGKRVAAVFELSPEYVSRLRGRAHAGGSEALVRRRGRPPKLSERQVRQARVWAGQGVSQTEIAARLKVARSVVGEALGRLGPIPCQPDLPVQSQREGEVPGQWRSSPDSAGWFGDRTAADRGDDEVADQDAAAAGDDRPAADDPAEAADPAEAGQTAGANAETAMPAVVEEQAVVAERVGPVAAPAARITEGVFPSRYAGAMLVHAFTDRVDATAVLAGVTGPAGAARFDDVGLLAAISMAFTLGAATVEQVKHLTGVETGPLCGLARLPDLRTLRPRLAALADGCDPLALQRAFASAMLRAEPCESGVYLVDDHFVPYAGAKPVPKGWNTKRRTAQRGRADTWVADHRGRAVCFTTGEPSGLTKTLPGALAELRAVVGPHAPIMLAFDRGGAYPSVFTACRDAGADWITYRRAPLAVPARLPLATTIVRAGTPTQVVWCDETVTIDGYGSCRQLTLFEAGTPALQVLTSDTGACPAELLACVKSRWRVENVFKYADHYGIDALCDYLADIETNTRPVDNPARKAANATLATANTALAHAERALAQLLDDRSLTVAQLNDKLGPAQRKIHKLKKAVAAADQARHAIPAKLPANQIDPTAQRALLRTGRRGLQMVLRLLGYNAEHWLADRLNAYLHDDDEYRAITRQTLIRGLRGTLTYAADSITVELDRPATPKTARALALLVEEINNTPPRLPGDPRPLTYTVTEP